MQLLYTKKEGHRGDPRHQRDGRIATLCFSKEARNKFTIQHINADVLSARADLKEQ
ncbi:MAG: hypothetical protein ABSF55_03740 [Candidatus Staskawiczbacteria bacterium]